uniref:Uncharacterized protein n=1 Tax=Setaria italica TaxID=4555 RepID=K4ANU0_SETIT
MLSGTWNTVALHDTSREELYLSLVLSVQECVLAQMMVLSTS